MNPDTVTVRPVRPDDLAQWRPLWDGYNAFYGREGETALDEAITQQTWERFFVAADPVKAFVAELSGQLVGLVHIVYHPSTSRQSDVCYLHDLFTATGTRSRGVGQTLIERVYTEAKARGCSRVYWSTFAENQTARRLYDRMTRYDGAIMYVKEL